MSMVSCIDRWMPNKWFTVAAHVMNYISLTTPKVCFYSFPVCSYIGPLTHFLFVHTLVLLCVTITLFSLVFQQGSPTISVRENLVEWSRVQ